MIKGYFYCLYDNMYEEYQMPFVMRNDNVALMEFNTFKSSLKEKAKSDKEKQDIDKRFHLMKYEDIEWSGDGFFSCKDNSFHCYELTEADE